MAIEIRELVIKAVIIEDDADFDPESDTMKSNTATAEKDQLVQECVDQVLKILRRTNKR